MALPGTYDLEIYQGDTFTFGFRTRASTAIGGPGDYMDMTGATARAQIRVSEDAATPLASFACTIPTQTGDNLGRIDLKLTPAQTTALTSPTMLWDVEITFSDGTVRTLLRGKVTVTKEVTR